MRESLGEQRVPCGVLLAEQAQGEMQGEWREAKCSQRCSATTKGYS